MAKKADVMPPQRDYTAERDAAVVPVARELIKLVAARADELVMGQVGVSETKAAELAQKMYKEDVIPLVMKHNLRLNELPYLFSIILQPFTFLNDMTTSSMEMNRDLADARLYGIDDIDELRISDLDNALKGVAKTAVKKVQSRREKASGDKSSQS